MTSIVAIENNIPLELELTSNLKDINITDEKINNNASSIGNKRDLIEGINIVHNVLKKKKDGSISEESSSIKKEREKIVICSADNFFTKNGVYEWDGKKISEAHNECQTDFKEAIELKKNSKTMRIYIDNTNIHWWEYKDYLKTASHITNTVIVEFMFDDKDILYDDDIPEEERICKRNNHKVPIHTVKGMHKRFQPFSFKKLPKTFNESRILVYRIKKKKHPSTDYIITHLSKNCGKKNLKMSSSIKENDIFDEIYLDLVEQKWWCIDSFPVFIFRGIPGAGKSTFIKKLEEVEKMSPSFI